MKLFLVTCLLIVCSFSVKAGAEEEAAEKPEITKLELVNLGEGESDVDASDLDVQRKRDSGYSYKRPGGFAPAQRARFQPGPHGNKGRIVNRHPAQVNRPVTKYGPPGYQNPPPARPASHSQQHRDKLQFHGHFGQQHHGNFNGRPSGLLEQEVPSPIRQVDFVEPNPISSQNNEPFATHAANYLPPANQKLPGYATPHPFSESQAAQVPQDSNQGQLGNLQSQELVQPQAHLSDAALFLAQNAQAIQQLYGAPATDQDFAPNDSQFLGQTNQVPSGQFQNLETSSHGSQGFPGLLPSYASGTLGAQETLEQIQSIEKDRLIVQLQRALATQAQSAEAGRYAENQSSFVQNQDLLASLGQRMKIGLNAQPSTAQLGQDSTAFNQSPFLPGTTISPGFPLSYGLTTTLRPPTTIRPPTTTITATATPTQTPQAAKGDGTSQVGSTAPPLSTAAAGVPVYGGFVPTLIAAPSFVSNVPTYGPTFLAPGTVASVQPSGSVPTHFGIPIPTDSQKPASGTTPPSVPSATPSTPSTSRPSAPATPTFGTLPLHPVTTPLHPVVAPFQPVTPLQPVLPPTHVHPVQTPTYGPQPSLISPFLVKPVKPVYPFYYYPNVPYQLHKPTLPAYPWSYAPTYAPAKPAQIWK